MLRLCVPMEVRTSSTFIEDQVNIRKKNPIRWSRIVFVLVLPVLFILNLTHLSKWFVRCQQWRIHLKNTQKNNEKIKCLWQQGCRYLIKLVKMWFAPRPALIPFQKNTLYIVWLLGITLQNHCTNSSGCDTVPNPSSRSTLSCVLAAGPEWYFHGFITSLN